MLILNVNSQLFLFLFLGKKKTKRSVYTATTDINNIVKDNTNNNIVIKRN